MGKKLVKIGAASLLAAGAGAAIIAKNKNNEQKNELKEQKKKLKEKSKRA